MEYLVFVFLIVLLIIIANQHSGLVKRLEAADKKASRLEEKLNRLILEIGKLKLTDTTVKSSEPMVEKPPVVSETVKPVEERLPLPPIVQESSIPVARKADPEESKSRPVAVPPPRPPKPVAPKKPSFWERNPDLEKFIGENLINKIGIAILVLGIGFFVKYAIDQNWINEIGRVAIGILCGGLLIGIAHRLRLSFKAFSSVLVGGGLAVFYFTIAIAFHDYHIFSQAVSFVLMVVITAFSILLSIAYNRQELAVLAIIGGFVSPLLLSTGSGNYITLFSYVLILNTGMIVLAYFKRWNIVNIVSYAFTVLLYGSWLALKVLGADDTQQPPYVGALVFASVFYVVFFLMNIVNNIKENKTFIASEIMILVSNTCLYYSAGMLILHRIDEGLYQGLFTVLMAAFNFFFAYALYKSKKADNNLIYLLIGMVLTFVSLTAPVQLQGNYITLFWAAEAVLLLWLFQKSGIVLMKVASVLINLLMLGSLMMDWIKLYEYTDPQMTVVLNKAFITGIFAVISVGLTLLLLRKEKDKLLGEVLVEDYKLLLSAVFGLLLYLVPLLELNFQLNTWVDDWAVRATYLFLYHFVFIASFIGFTLRNSKTEFYIWASFLLTGAACLAYAAFYGFMVEDLRDAYFRAETVGIHYYIHYLLSLLLLLMVAGCGLLLHRKYSLSAKEFRPFLWLSTLVVVALVSLEVRNILMGIFYTQEDAYAIYELRESVVRISYPIIWGLCSFAAMYIGMRKKIKTYRIIALVIFSVTLLKLFIFDVSRMSEGGKIASFISLGVLLLIISFMYQKLKKIIIEDDKGNQ